MKVKVKVKVKKKVIIQNNQVNKVKVINQIK